MAHLGSKIAGTVAVAAIFAGVYRCARSGQMHMQTEDSTNIFKAAASDASTVGGVFGQPVQLVSVLERLEFSFQKLPPPEEAQFTALFVAHREACAGENQLCKRTTLPPTILDRFTSEGAGTTHYSWLHSDVLPGLLPHGGFIYWKKEEGEGAFKPLKMLKVLTEPDGAFVKMGFHRKPQAEPYPEGARKVTPTFFSENVEEFWYDMQKNSFTYLFKPGFKALEALGPNGDTVYRGQMLTYQLRGDDVKFRDE